MKILSLAAPLALLCAAPIAQAASPLCAERGAATLAGAKHFIACAERKLSDDYLVATRAEWLMTNFITFDTQALSADASRDSNALVTRLERESRPYRKLALSAEQRRKLELLRQGPTAPAPDDAAKRAELSTVLASMQSAYGAGRWCPPNEAGRCYTLDQLEEVLAKSRDPKALRDAWVGWRTVAPSYRDKYSRFVELANEGAREFGYKDLGVLWRSGYDMPADKFPGEMERLWQQVKPLYDSLHTYTRYKLIEKYGDEARRADGLIPSHLLGNMWAQEWSNIFPILKPAEGDPGEDLDAALEARKLDGVALTKIAESFFTSVGLRSLPDTFWERSLFTRPRDRDVVCHASAWPIDEKDDVRLKMCLRPTAGDLITAHHELGHVYYFLAYADQPKLFRTGANDGFHEAIGDMLALSVTPGYLKSKGLIEHLPDEKGQIAVLLNRALDKVAFLPFGYMVDQWRWEVFSGQVKPDHYNAAWWELAAKYQGIAPAVPRSEKDFDAGSKYHVAANTPYARYFLAHILQFQFHRALCREIGFKGPLHQCSIAGNKQAGAKLQKMLAMGASKPWPDALEVMTGQREVDATAVLEYFAPLKTWLDAENKRLAAQLDK